MSFAAPWALVGLVALPILWWIARSRRLRPPVLLPSLLFLRAETSAASPRRRALDLDLALAWLGAGAVALAAAAPYLRSTLAGRTVTVVVSGGAPASARGQAEARSDMLAGLEDHLQATDRLERIEVPGVEGGDVPRPDAAALLDAALAHEEGLRAIVSDLDPPPGLPPGLLWVRTGVEDARNVGLVRAHLEPEPTSGGWSVFALAQASGPEGQTVALEVETGSGVRERLPARVLVDGAVAPFETRLGAETTRVRLRLVAADGAPWKDDLPFDDEVVFSREPVWVRVGAALAPDVARDFQLAAEASVGPEGLRVTGAATGSGIEIDAGDGPWTLLLPGASGSPDRVFAGEGVDVAAPDPLVRDLSTRGCDLGYPPALLGEPGTGPATPGESSAEAGARRHVLLARLGARSWPVVSRHGRTVTFLPDPRAGRRPPTGTALWPLFVDDLLRVVAGTRAGLAPGWRLQGLLDPASSTLGRTRDAGSPWPDALATTPFDRRGVRTSLGPGLALLGLAAWGALWFRGRGRTPRRAVRSFA